VDASDFRDILVLKSKFCIRIKMVNVINVSVKWNTQFLPRDAIVARYMLLSCVRLFVCPYVTSRHCTKTVKCRITQTTPYDSPGALVLWCQKSRQNSNGVSPMWPPNRGGVSLNGNFRPIFRYLENGAR